MPPSKRLPPPTAPRGATSNTVRKVTRTLTVSTGTDALKVADAIAARTDPPMVWEQVNPDFEAERIAGPRDTSARWRFNIPGPMLVVAEADLPIIKALIEALDAERKAAQL